jgi:hypothetical protein
MSFNFDGYVLRPARFAGANAPSSSEATSGVSRAHITPAEMGGLGYDDTPARPVEPYADQYRASFLLSPEQAEEEYLIFAASSGSWSELDSALFLKQGDVTLTSSAAGNLSVTGGFDDGTASLFVRDGGGRQISTLSTLTLQRGDNSAEVVAAYTFTPTTGKAVLDAATLSALGGGFSVERGDVILSFTYQVSPPTFWWTKNDPDTERFGWDARAERWAPLPGTTPANLGAAGAEDSYKLNPPPSRYVVGEELPGDSSTPDDYAVVRAGTRPDATSLPLEVLVVSNEDASGDYPAAGAAYDAVVGETSGTLLLNPTWLTTNIGLTLWYSRESYPQRSPEQNGELGSLGGLAVDSNIDHPVLAPVPLPWEHPLIRLGFRRWLTAIGVDTDADLPLPSAVSEGEVYWSRTTGKCSFSAEDIRKATPGEVGYQLPYLGAKIFSDGVVLSSQPLQTKAAAPLVDENGDELDGVGAGIPNSGPVYLLRALPLPAPGTGGVEWVPDGSGDLPDPVSTPPETRVNGSGLVRSTEGVGDSFFFCGSRALAFTEVFEYEEDLTTFEFRVPQDEAQVARNVAASQPTGSTDASRVKLKRRRIDGEPLYFVQPTLTPARWTNTARIYARKAGLYSLDGSEVIRFSIDGTTYEWLASTLGAPANPAGYTAAEIAASLNTLIGATRAGAERGYLFLEAADPSSGSVEISWNTEPSDLSGHSALGLLPGWRIDTGDSRFRWLVDSGVSYGMFRSPQNLDRSTDVPDVVAEALQEETQATCDIAPVPFFTVYPPPLEDVPGWEDDVHFQIVAGLNTINLRNRGVDAGTGLSIRYEFEDNRIRWASVGTLSSTAVLQATTTLDLGNTSVFNETVDSAAMATEGTGYGLYVRDPDATSFTELVQGTEYLLPGNGAAGYAQLIALQGQTLTSGGGGTYTAGGTFSNPNLSPDATTDAILQANLLATVDPGDWLYLEEGDEAGLYQITSKALVSGDATFDVTPPFSGGGTGISWEIFVGRETSVYDPSVIADVQQVPFGRLPPGEEDWEIWTLEQLGTAGGSLAFSSLEELADGRVLQVRFGQSYVPANITTPRLITEGTEVGTIAATGLTLDTSDSHFQNSTSGAAYFQLRVGEVLFQEGVTLSLVTSFSPTTPAGTIEVGEFGSGISGQVQIASDVVSVYAGATLLYDQTLFAGSVLSAGEVEIDPSTGDIQISDADATTYAGQPVYLSQRARIPEDVQVSPLNGSLFFAAPLRAGTLVESRYRTADASGLPVGSEIVEFLPILVRLEEATRIDAFTYSFNPTGRTLGGERGDEFVWVDPELQNFAGVPQATVNDDSTITFSASVSASSTVLINYLVLEAFGGERAYQVSTPPVARLPILLGEGQTELVLEGDRTSEAEVGKALFLGQTPLYVKAVSYDATADTTTIEVWPPPLTELGSRAPGQDPGSVLTDRPVAITIDPSDPVSGGGDTGFFLEVSPATNPNKEGTPGASQITFEGNTTTFMKVGHLLEVEGYPYLVTGSTLSEDGSYTQVDLGNPVYQSHPAGSACRVTARPVYGITPTTFVGSGPFLEGTYRLFLVEEGQPGELLVAGVDYEADSGTGQVTLLQGPLPPGAKLIAAFTAVDVLGPAISGGAVVTPFYSAQYLYGVTPDEGNGIQGSTLLLRYSYRSPDSFYTQVQPLPEFLPVVAEAALAASAPPSGGGTTTLVPGCTTNSNQGGLGTRGDASAAGDLDAGAARYLEFYQRVIESFEEVLELRDGRRIGDQDGKFRYRVPRGRAYAPPGWEDDITAEVNPRLIWREIIDEWADAAALGDGYFRKTDPLSSPTATEEADPSDRPGETDGRPPNPSELAIFIELQRGRVSNDIEDEVLIGLEAPTGLRALLPKLNLKGRFAQLWEPSTLSRLFPERTRHFSRLGPGLLAVRESDGSYSDPGFFTPGRRVSLPGPEPGEETTQLARTRNEVIGSVSNPALGRIENVVEIDAQGRRARARVWRFYPEGSARLDAVLGTTTVGSATFVLSQVPLSQFPLAGGFPDTTQLLSQGGEIEDISSGSNELFVPAWAIQDQVGLGLPPTEGVAGRSYLISDPDGNGVFVGAVQVGCVVTLVDVTGNPLTGADLILSGSGVDLSQGAEGYTLFVVAPTPDLSTVPGEGDSPTLTQTTALASADGGYRIQFDLGVLANSGLFRDRTLAGRDDFFPLPLRDIFGQRPPEPLSTIEGTVEFRNTSRTPAQLPALLGQARDDSGDERIPYLQERTGELTLLAQIAEDFELFLSQDTGGTPYTPPRANPDETQGWGAVYPDELRSRSGEFFAARTLTPSRDPARLYTDEDLRPVETAGSYTADSGLGDSRPFDLLFLEVGQPLVPGSLPAGWTGIFRVAEVQGHAATGESISWVERPRFVAEAPRGEIHKYTVRNAYGYTSGTFPATSGVQVGFTGPGPIFTSTYAFGSSGAVLDSGGTLAGGILALTGSGTNGNAIVIRFFDPNPLAAGDAFLGAIVIVDQSSGGTLYVYQASSGTTFTPLLSGTGVTYTATATLQMLTVGIDPLSLIGLTSGNYYDYTIAVDAYWDSDVVTYTGGALTLGSGPGSLTCEVDRDRLTFRERVSFASALPRNSYPANGNTTYDLGASLAVWEVTASAVGDCTVNAPSEVNGGSPFTFLERAGPSPDGSVSAGTAYVGTFVPGAAGSEDGELRVLSWEEDNNTPLGSAFSGVRLSIAASSDLEGGAPILVGSGFYQDSTAALLTVDGTRNWIGTVTASSGALTNPEAGDVVVVDQATGGTAAVKSGTYLLRHAVPTNLTSSGGTDLQAEALRSDAGTAAGLDLRWPEVHSLSGSTLILRGVVAAPYSNSGSSYPDPATTGGNEWVYLVLKDRYSTYDGSTYTVDPDAVYRAEYSALGWDATTNEVTLTLTGTYEDALGNSLTASQFAVAAAVGTRASGMTYLPLVYSDLAANNLVGHREDSIGTDLTAGLRRAIFGNRYSPNHGSTTSTAQTWDKLSSPGDVERLFTSSVAAATGSLGVRVPDPSDSTEFYPDRREAIYGRSYALASTAQDAVEGVFEHLDIHSLTDTDWNAIHFDTSSGISASSHRLRCILPGDRIMFGDDLDPGVSNPGIYFTSGLFLEASVIRPVPNLGETEPQWVANSYALTGQTSRVGSRNFRDYTSSSTFQEEVLFTVRRIRRFHEIQADLASLLGGLAPLYEIRRGDFSSYSTSTRVFTAGTATYGTATNVGDFNEAQAQIQAGDELRVFDGDGNLLATAEVQRVLSATTLKLRRPGLLGTLAGAASFEVYLRSPLVPGEQSAEELLGAATDTLVFERKVDYGSGDTEGGQVTGSFNEMQDSLIADWNAVGVQAGDIVVVDPSGPLYVTGESGVRPIGDQSQSGRTNYLTGEPNPLDDNRGFYRVTSLSTGDLLVDGTNRFAGGLPDGTQDVILGAAGSEFGLLPTVRGSALTSTDPTYPFGGAEGQNSLRPTGAPVASSYASRTGFDALKSIEPFAYKIIRPTALLSEDAIDLILFQRERLLSWIESLRSAYAVSRGGDYYIFQRDDHLTDLGSPTDPATGLGVLSNLLITSLQGLTSATPYENTSDALSLLGRRFWLQDPKLDDPGYTDFAGNTLDQRPLLEDLIAEVLDEEDRLRDLRYSWIRFRTDQVSGSLQEKKRALQQLEELLGQAREYMLQQKALDS